MVQIRNAPPTEAAIATMTPTVALVIVVADEVVLLLELSAVVDGVAEVRTVE